MFRYLICFPYNVFLAVRSEEGMMRFVYLYVYNVLLNMLRCNNDISLISVPNFPGSTHWTAIEWKTPSSRYLWKSKRKQVSCLYSRLSSASLFLPFLFCLFKRGLVLIHHSFFLIASCIWACHKEIIHKSNFTIIVCEVLHVCTQACLSDWVSTMNACYPQLPQHVVKLLACMFYIALSCSCLENDG